MKYLALAAVVASCQPAYAELSETLCFEAPKTLETMKEHGYTITFGDLSSDPNVFMAEKEDGNWILFVVKHGILCIMMDGEKGVHFSRPPNV